MKRYSSAASLALAIVTVLGLATSVVAASPREHALPIKLDYRCFGDATSLQASAEGFATVLGHWTAQGSLETVNIDPNADQAEITGTLAVFTANGDKLFVSFTASWQLSTGLGMETIVVTGGTGRFAGASGSASGHCTMTIDPVSSTFGCNCTGIGILILPNRS